MIITFRVKSQSLAYWDTVSVEKWNYSKNIAAITFLNES